MTTQRRRDSIFQRALPTKLMYLLGKYVPPRLANGVVWSITQVILAMKADNYYGALANMAHVMPPETSRSERIHAVRRLFHYSSLSYYHLFHNIDRSDQCPDAFEPRVEMAPQVRGYVEEAVATGRGLFILGSHSSNFDLCGIALSHYTPLPAQALSLADPAPGYQFMNNLRAVRGRGMITPIAPDTLRDAIQRLRNGGIVFTGVDRPIPNANSPVTFFGQTAYLPTGYIRIPLIADCLVMTVSFLWDGQIYHILGNPPMEMVRTGNRARDAEVNVQRVLVQIEDFVRAAPDQWMVFLPVWPDHAGEPAAAGR